MSKIRVAVQGTVGKSILIDTSLGPKLEALTARVTALENAGGSTLRHSSLQGLQIGNDHPQYPLSRARESIIGQWNFTQQIWAKQGTEALPGYSFSGMTGTGLFGNYTPPDTAVSLLLHMDGANGGTAFPDSSNNAFVMTNVGAPVTSTTSPMFGTASLRVNGSSYIGRIDSAGDALDLGGGDFTVEGWFKVDALGASTQCIFSFAGVGMNPLFRLYLDSGGTMQIQPVLAGVSWSTFGHQTAVTAGVWYSFAVVRTGNTGILFLNGVKSTSTATDWTGTPVWPDRFSIGASSNMAGFSQFESTGNVDEVRITKGLARYVANYTPAGPFPDATALLYESISVDADEKFRFGQAGQFGIGGANYGSAGNYMRSAGSSAAPAWTATEALTKADDTNVTLTLGGAPTTALFTATSLTLGWTGQLSVPRGGTGLATVAQGDLLYGSAADTYSRLAKSVTAAQYLTNTGTSNNPAWAPLPGGFSGFANPSASVGLAAVNGSATTAMRSDGAPALDQGITPNWTGLHKFNAAGGTQVLSGTTTVNSNQSGGADAAHLIDIVNDATAYQVLRLSTYGTPASIGGQNNFHWQRARGTVAAPTAVKSADTFMSMGYRGHDGTAISGSAAAFSASATEDWSNAAHGIKFEFQVTPNGSVTRATMFSIASDNVYTPGLGFSVGITAPVNTAANRGNVTVNGSAASIVNLAVAGALESIFYADGTQTLLGSSTSTPLRFRTNATLAVEIAASGQAKFVGGAGTSGIFGDGAGDEFVGIDGGAAQLRGFFLRTAGSNRWALLAENTAESGSNAGSNFEIWAFSDAGGFLNTALSISRANSRATFGGVVQLKNFTVATLPAGVRGDTAYVTDALAPTFGAAVVGGGAVVIPVFYNGASWVSY